MSFQQTIVVGANGDLGSQLAAELTSRQISPLTFDQSSPLMRAVFMPGMHSIVHLCIPASSVEEYAWLADLDDVIVVLHDSVMATSQRLNQDYFQARAGVVHILMNETRTVVIDHDSAHHETIRQHMAQAGFRVEMMPSKAHDHIMAISQAPMLLLRQTIYEPLQRYHSQGLLTPSGEKLIQALDSRVSTCTPATIRSVLANPELHELVRTMQAALDEIDTDHSVDKRSSP